MTSRNRNRLAEVTIACLLSACGGGDDRIEPPPIRITETEDLEFALEDFTEITPRNSFEVIVQQGDHFSIDVTVDKGLADLIQVDLEGFSLRIGFDEDYAGDIRSDVTQAVVTMPRLTAIEAVNSADTVVVGFTTGYVEIALDGSARIEAASCRFDFVSALLNGSSELLLRDESPIPATNLQLAGSSSASVTMMSGGTIAGFATGSSSIRNYGSAVTVQVTNSGTASVARLGDTLD